MQNVGIKDRFAIPTPSGYRDILLKVRAENGHVTELQLHLKGILEVKDGPGHKLYEAQRAIWTAAEKESRVVTPQEAEQIRDLNAQMRAFYDAKYEEAIR
jgi:hypothetical protein